jgi:hypothetical protein
MEELIALLDAHGIEYDPRYCGREGEGAGSAVATFCN